MNVRIQMKENAQSDTHVAFKKGLEDLNVCFAHILTEFNQQVNSFSRRS